MTKVWQMNKQADLKITLYVSIQDMLSLNLNWNTGYPQ
jgi:hypothetical protein